MIRHILSIALLITSLATADAQNWRRTANGFVMNGRQYVLGRDDFCCGKASCQMQRELWAAFSAARNARSVTQASQAIQEAETSFAPIPTSALATLWEVIRPRPGQLVIDPGCGDARVLIDAARRFGAVGAGIEINPNTAAMAKRNVAAARLSQSVRVTTGDSRKYSFRDADYVFVYLYDDLINELRPKFESLRRGAIVVSYQHELPMSGTVAVESGENRFYVWVKR